MTIIKTQNANGISLELTGRLDTATAPQLDATINAISGDVRHLILDLSGLEYLSSAGLRVILMAQKKMAMSGSMTVRNVNETIMEVFKITGFTNILNIEAG
jgi:anti-sigma B factor antagonist